MAKLITVGVESRQVWLDVGLEQITCPCGECPLDLHQPRSESPYRLLGVCPECGAWNLVLTEGDHAVVVRLPDPDVLLKAATPNSV
jgi:hypothetical protein